jgi:hypothetical protein
MAARHGGGLRVVAEPAPAGRGHDYVVHGDWGPVDPARAVFDPSAGVVRVAATGGDLGGLAIRAAPFERLFPATAAGRLPDLEELRRLGEALRSRDHDDARDRETDIPAAYTYFAQFVFHDITHWKPPRGAGPRAGLRDAALDLDSVLGFEPADRPDGRGPLPLGLTARDPCGRAWRADLPRSPCGAALIPDGRNDDNLALAQVHVAMIAFANAVRATVGPAGGAAALAATHVQAAVLGDLLPRLLDPDVVRDVAENGRAVVWPEGRAGDLPFHVPLEFVAACGRFGHSMVKYRYDWNAHHPGAGAPAFWESTHASTDYPMRMLDWSWVTDWSRLLPAGEGAAADARWPLRAAALSSRLAEPLKRMPEAALPPPGPGQAPLSANLATRSLERAHALRLASGQEAVRRMNERLAAAGRPTVPLLSRDDILAGEGDAARALLLAEGPAGARLCDETPMWLYGLKEAEAQQGGRRLGAFVSRIVAETLHAAIAAATPSILGRATSGGGAWRPDPRLGPSRPDAYGLRDLVAFAGLLEPTTAEAVRA